MKLTKRNKKKLIAAIIVLFVLTLGVLSEQFGFALPGLSQENVITQATSAGFYNVVDIEDGDTITVRMNGTQERVRFIGVDTPETRDPRKPVQCFGKAASNFTKQLIGENNVRLEADPDNTNRDRYNRLLRYVYLPDGTMLNATIIEQGYGFAYTSFPFTKKAQFKQLEQEARAANRGLWGECKTGVDENGYNTINADPNP